MPSLELSVLAQRLSVCRLGSQESIPEWATGGEFFNVVRTKDELSIVCGEEQVPPGIQQQTDWRAFKVEGPLDFALTGILAGLSAVLARAEVSIFAISTFDTDYILVPERTLATAVAALRNAGYDVNDSAQTATAEG